MQREPKGRGYSIYVLLSVFYFEDGPDTVSVNTSHQKVVAEVDFSGGLWVRIVWSAARVQAHT